jgi:phosphatidylserine/phosphatidylglycerophosphate/cardiolipin synthase-like enzyme
VITSFFNPPATIAQKIAGLIDAANHSLLFQQYEWDNAEITLAVNRALKRGVSCQIVIDKAIGSKPNTQLRMLFQTGAKITVDKQHAIAHNKVTIIDGSVVITGSFNFSENAQDANAENAIITDDQKTVTAYLANWNLHRSHSNPWPFTE